MRKDTEPTEFGLWLMRKMAAHEPPLSQAELARRSGIGQATISRWIFQEHTPDTRKLEKLATALDVSFAEVLTIAGHGTPAEDISAALAGLRPGVEPLAAELSAMLEDGSPLTEQDRQMLEQVVDRLIDPYRKLFRTRRTA
jgi:transcriptional regulator with XRE-family HTH domain